MRVMISIAALFALFQSASAFRAVNQQKRLAALEAECNDGSTDCPCECHEPHALLTDGPVDHNKWSCGGESASCAADQYCVIPGKFSRETMNNACQKVDESDRNKLVELIKADPQKWGFHELTTDDLKDLGTEQQEEYLQTVAALDSCGGKTVGDKADGMGTNDIQYTGKEVARWEGCGDNLWAEDGSVGTHCIEDAKHLSLGTYKGNEKCLIGARCAGYDVTRGFCPADMGCIKTRNGRGAPFGTHEGRCYYQTTGQAVARYVGTIAIAGAIAGALYVAGCFIAPAFGIGFSYGDMDAVAVYMRSISLEIIPELEGEAGSFVFGAK